MTCKARKLGGAFAMLTLFLGLSSTIGAAAETDAPRLREASKRQLTSTRAR